MSAKSVRKARQSTYQICYFRRGQAFRKSSSSASPITSPHLTFEGATKLVKVIGISRIAHILENGQLLDFDKTVSILRGARIL
jgi:hypothetical protein